MSKLIIRVKEKNKYLSVWRDSNTTLTFEAQHGFEMIKLELEDKLAVDIARKILTECGELC